MLVKVIHLVDGAGPVMDLLRHAPSCVCVITSRERLNTPGEWVFPVNGLSYAPDPASPPSAPQLFIASAQRLESDVTFDADDRRAIDDICRLVDGNPLAIELAATWRRAFSCREIAVEIERSFDFLEAERQDAPERHRSLRAVFAHSWALLDPQEQKALYRRGCSPLCWINRSCSASLRPAAGRPATRCTIWCSAMRWKNWTPRPAKRNKPAPPTRATSSPG